MMNDHEDGAKEEVNRRKKKKIVLKMIAPVWSALSPSRQLIAKQYTACMRVVFHSHKRARIKPNKKIKNGLQVQQQQQQHKENLLTL